MSQPDPHTPLTHSFLERCVAASKAYVAHCRNTVGKIDSGVLQDGYRKVAEMALSRALDFQQEVYTMLEAGTAASETRAHTDHPSRHFDRTCPACIAEEGAEGYPGISHDFESMRTALGEILRHCDATPDGETDFERAVIAGRAALKNAAPQEPVATGAVIGSSSPAAAACSETHAQITTAPGESADTLKRVSGMERGREGERPSPTCTSDKPLHASEEMLRAVDAAHRALSPSDWVDDMKHLQCTLDALAPFFARSAITAPTQNYVDLFEAALEAVDQWPASSDTDNPQFEEAMAVLEKVVVALDPTVCRPDSGSQKP